MLFSGAMILFLMADFSKCLNYPEEERMWNNVEERKFRYGNENSPRIHRNENRRQRKPGKRFDSFDSQPEFFYEETGNGNLPRRKKQNQNGQKQTNADFRRGNEGKMSKKEGIVLLGEEQCGVDIPRRIIGGTTTDIDEFPWLTLLEYLHPSGKVSHDCGGVLISKKYVLTAAHCTHGLALTRKNIKLIRVRLGEWDLSTDKDCQGEVCSAPAQELDVEETIPHEEYEPAGKTQVHDLSLVRLKTEANFNDYVQPICLPFDGIGRDGYEGKKLTVSGWGRTTNARDSSSKIKKKVDLPVVDWNKCSRFYQSFYGDLKISKSQFCAGGESGQDSCQGDSGGPLMTIERENNEIRWYLIGIVSSGPAACGVQDRPSLYTNISQYTNWIVGKIKSNRKS